MAAAYRTRPPATVLWIAILIVIGCDPGDVVLSEASDVGAGGTAIDVSVIALEDNAPPEWSGGVPGATVHVGRTSNHGFPWQTVRTDSMGGARIDRAEPGLYWIAAEATTETGGTYAGGEKLATAGTEEAIVVALWRQQSGSLVINEVYTTEPPPWVYETIGENKYVEIFNNSDRTIHLDGKLIGVFYEWYVDTGYFGHHRCADTEPLRNDPAGVWAAVIWRFPGSGSQHPLESREAAVIAVSAADHRPAHESFLDLSGASFEFLLPGLADNPAVPNMVAVGTRPHREQDFLGDAQWFIADGYDVNALPRLRDPGGDPGNPFTDTYVRIPAEGLHDVAFLLWDRYGRHISLPLLPFRREPVHPDFDRIPGGYVKEEHTLFQSIQRRHAANGYVLDTNVSRVDFRMATRTPGR